MPFLPFYPGMIFGSGWNTFRLYGSLEPSRSRVFSPIWLFCPFRFDGENQGDESAGMRRLFSPPFFSSFIVKRNYGLLETNGKRGCMLTVSRQNQW